MSQKTKRKSWINTNCESFLRNYDIRVRPNASHGIWMTLLLPICLGVCILKYVTTNIFIFAFIQATTSSIYTLICILNQNNNRKLDMILPSAISFIFCKLLLDLDSFICITCGFITCLSMKHSLIYSLRKCPASFTLGEAVFITQSLILFSLCSFINMFNSYKNPPVEDNDVITLILQMGMISVILVVLTLLSIHSKVNINRFIFVVCFYITLMLLTLHILLEQSPILWMIFFIFDNLQRVSIIGFWVLATIIAVVSVRFQISSGSKASTSRRKIFHLLAAFVYIPGVIYECNLVYLASGIALAAIIALETVRKLNIGWFSETLNDGFQVFSDEKDVGGISITPMYLLLGIAGPIFLHPLHCVSILPLLSGVLSVGIGDTAASYIGSKFGQTKWPGMEKSYVGTMANIISQLLILYILYKFNFIVANNFSITICLTAVVLNSIVEAITDQVDNITLPIITFTMLILI